MNYSVTAKPMNLPISLDRQAPRPVTAVAEAASAFRDARQQPSPVYRGELLEEALDRSYRPQANLQVSPENRRAIDTYQMIAGESSLIGKILDGYI